MPRKTPPPASPSSTSNGRERTPPVPIPDSLPASRRLSLSEAAPYAGLHRVTLLKLAQKGQLAGAKLVHAPGMPHPAWVITVRHLRAFVAQERPHGVLVAYREKRAAPPAQETAPRPRRAQRSSDGRPPRSGAADPGGLIP